MSSWHGSFTAGTPRVVAPDDDLAPPDGPSRVVLSDDAPSSGRTTIFGRPVATLARSMQQRMRKIADHARALPPAKVDAVLALVLVAVSTVEAAVADDVSLAARAGYAGLAGVVAAALCARRRAPVGAALAGMSAIVGIGLLPRAITEVGGAPFLAVLFLVFSMSLRTHGRRLLLASVAALALLALAISTDRYDDKVGDLVFAPSLFVVAPVALGQMLRSRAALAETLREKAHNAARGRELHAQQAVSDERARVAEELHDVVAHALGAMTVQASAARRLAATEPDRAREAFGAVEATGRDALTELRALLGVLRRDDEELALAPPPRLANLRDLARRTSAAGLPVELLVDGDAPDELPAGVDLTAYRLVQEALGEALRGAAGRARVRVRYRGAEVLLEVADDGHADQARRLLGVHERVRVYGGSLEAGAGPEGGYRVRARLPVGATA
jgi:signal transduction histidine kinase